MIHPKALVIVELGNTLARLPVASSHVSLCQVASQLRNQANLKMGIWLHLLPLLYWVVVEEMNSLVMRLRGYLGGAIRS